MYICLQTCYHSDLKHIHNVMFPVMYAAEEGNITEDLAKSFNTTVYGEIILVDDLFVAGIVASCVPHSPCVFLYLRCALSGLLPPCCLHHMLLLLLPEV